MPKKRIVMWVETNQGSTSHTYLVKEEGSYYAEYVKKGGIVSRAVIAAPDKILVSANRYVDLTRVTR